MRSTGHITGELLLVLVTAVCLAASGSYAAQSSTASSTPKPVSRPSTNSTHPTATHPAVRKAGTRTTASHSGTNRRVASHRSSAHYAARRSTAHASSASAAKNAPAHTPANATQHKGSQARHRTTRARTSQQRLARLHLQPERTQEIQQALIREGYLQGDASGQWDSRTHDAMLRYQTDHGFPATGLPEAKSLMKLGLGSHPLPPELDHSTVGVASPGASQGHLTVEPPSPPPVSQVMPPS